MAAPSSGTLKRATERPRFRQKPRRGIENRRSIDGQLDAGLGERSIRIAETGVAQPFESIMGATHYSPDDANHPLTLYRGTYDDRPALGHTAIVKPVRYADQLVRE